MTYILYLDTYRKQKYNESHTREQYHYQGNKQLRSTRIYIVYILWLTYVGGNNQSSIQIIYTENKNSYIIDIL